MMKIFLMAAAVLCTLMLNAQTPNLLDTAILAPVEVISVRAGDKTPVTKTNITRKEIEKINLGQDLPFILSSTPSVVSNSDAGNGIGYTGIRIRGSDASRINVTINGIPYNDAESQGTFFVDLPDLLSSAGSIQVQRGVGTSTNGAGAFGGSINISTNETDTRKSVDINNSFGSYGTMKNTVMLNSGMMGKYFNVSGRLSNLQSDGYIDRASTDLKSFFSSVAFLKKNTTVRLNIFSGKEKTYQAWNGVDENMLKINRRFNSAGTEKPGDPYEDETDNYTQTHYQLFVNNKLTGRIRSSLAFFLIKGKGYYQQYKAGEALADYGLQPYNDGSTIIEETDLIRRLWLDNDFYGSVFSLHYDEAKRNLVLGGNINQYDGKHFGEVIDAQVRAAVPYGHRWYDVDAEKTDLSGFIKWTEKLSERWQTYVDVQARNIDYKINGFRNNPTIRQDNNYLFFNPKAGISYNYGNTGIYFSYARAGKEPNRDDFEAGSELPRPEYLNDFEAGLERKHKKGLLAMNLFYMLYKDQLVLTGKINDVGAYTRSNIKDSYRAGAEIQFQHTFNKRISMAGNATFSSNRIRNFTEFIDDYDLGGQQQIYHGNTDIAFSPSVTAFHALRVVPLKNSEISFESKYVGRQFLDNSSNQNRSLDPYLVNEIRFSYSLIKSKTETKFFLQLNNIFSEKYEANGYTFSYVYGNSMNTENFYFPMAPMNVLAGINFRFW